MVRRKKEGMGFRGVSQRREKGEARRFTDEPTVAYLKAPLSFTGASRPQTASLKRLGEASSPVLPGPGVAFLWGCVSDLSL